MEGLGYFICGTSIGFLCLRNGLFGKRRITVLKNTTHISFDSGFFCDFVEFTSDDDKQIASLRSMLPIEVSNQDGSVYKMFQ